MFGKANLRFRAIPLLVDGRPTRPMWVLLCLGVLLIGASLSSPSSNSSRNDTDTYDGAAASPQAMNGPMPGAVRPAPGSMQNDDPGYAASNAPAGNVADGSPAPNTGDDADTNGYWKRQRSQDQSAQAFDGYINDTTTIQDTQNGEVHKDVDNSLADPAIQSGAATEVPTNELPTSSDSSSTSSSSSSSSTSSGE